MERLQGLTLVVCKSGVGFLAQEALWVIVEGFREVFVVVVCCPLVDCDDGLLPVSFAYMY